MLPIHKVDAENVTVVLFAGSLFTFFLWVFPKSSIFDLIADLEFLVVFKVLHNLEFRILTELFH